MSTMKIYLAQSTKNICTTKLFLNLSWAAEQVIKRRFEHQDIKFDFSNILNFNLYGDANKEIEALSKSLQKILDVDAVYFIEGWRSDRYCRLLNACCEEYGLTWGEIYNEEIILELSMERNLWIS